MRIGYIITSLIATAIILFFNAPTADAHNTYISIIKSESCSIVNCVSTGDLMKYDTSTQFVSGKFVFDEKLDDYKRAPGMKNSLEYYRVWNDKTIVFVTPDNYTIGRTKTITLTNTLPAYFDLGQKVKTEVDFNTDVRRYSEGAFIDSRCQNALIGVKEGGSVESILEFMVGGCVGDMRDDFVKEVITEKVHEYSCGQQCQHEKWMKEALEKSKTKNLLRER